MPTGRHAYETSTGKKLLTSAGKLGTDCVDGCECTGTLPETWQAELSGMANSSCATCTAIDGTYFPGSLSGCTWTTTSSECSVTITHNLSVVVVDASNVKVRYTLDFGGGDTIIFESSNILKTTLCCDIEEEVLTHTSGTGGGRCDASSATVTASAVCVVPEGCDLCTASVPENLQVVVPAGEFTSGTVCPNADCTGDLVGTHIVSRVTATECLWRKIIFHSVTCFETDLEASLFLSGSDVWVRVDFTVRGVPPNLCVSSYRYQSDTGSNNTISCTTLNESAAHSSTGLDSCCTSAQTSVTVKS